MSKPIINPFAISAQPNPEGDKNDWKIKTASNGLLFYFNTKTKKSQWDKPEVLKTPEERLNSTDWQEHTTGDGKVFYYNAKLKQSVWKMPPEVKAIKEKQAELRKQMSALDAQKPGGPKINVSITSSIAQEQEMVDYGPNYENLPHDQAVKIFMDVLRERTVPTMKWEQAQQIIKNDDRSKVITSFSEQRKLFKEWVVQSKNQERQEYKQRVQRARENFRHMLEERNQLNSDAKYYKVFQLFLNDPRWKALDEREREQTFQDFLDDLYERERDERTTKTRNGREELRKMLSADQEITPATKWDEICDKYKDNPVWNDLHEYDRIQVFSKWIIELDRQEHDEKRKNRRLQERKNREAFRDLLKEHIERRTLTHKTKWRHFVHAIKEDKRLYEMIGQNGSTPRELFEDQLESLKDQHKRTKDDMKKIFKDTSVKVTPEMSFQEFEAALSAQEEFKVMDAKSREYFFTYFMEKAKSKEKESQKKHKKALKRYTRFLKGLSDLKPDSEYKNFEKVIGENEQFAVLSQQEKEAQFNAHLQDLKNQDEGQISDEGLDKGKKKKTKKKRSKRKKNYESSEGEHRDSSEERSESRSRSRSEHRRKNKKEKRKGGKRSRSGSEDSDVEKKPEKKVQLDKEQGEQSKNKPEAMQEEKPEEKVQVAPVTQPIAVVNEKPVVAEAPAPIENKAMQQELPKEPVPSGEKDDQDEREEGETRESGRVERKSRSRSRSSRSESRERTKKKKKDRKHSKKGKKSEKKSKKKHRKRSYSPSESSDAD